MGSSGTFVNDTVDGTGNAKGWLIIFRNICDAGLSSLLLAIKLKCFS